MASENLIKLAMKLAKQLGANESKYLGKRTNISFLGKGPEEGKLFQSDINPEVLGNIELKTVLPQIETSMSYMSNGKLNDIQVNKLIDNLTKMNDFYYPITGDSIANVTDMASRTGNLTRGGLESLRGLGLKNLDNVEAAAAESPLMSRLGDRVKNIQTQTNDASAIMETIPKNEIPGKTASAREFLLNALKEGDDVGRTTFADTINPRDLKFITEGGGGVDGDPIVLVQKYFGPRVAELLPTNATVEDMAIFTKRIIEGSTDARGLRPTDQGFDNLTLKISEKIDDIPFADGGRARVGFKGGGADMGDPGRASERAERGYGQTADTGSRSGTNDYSNAVQNINHRAGLPGIDDGPNYTFNDSGLRGPLYGTNGITSVNRVTDGSLTAGYNSDEEEEDNIDTSILGPLTLDAANSIKSRNDLNAAKFAELNLADGGRANYRFGGLTKSLLKKLNTKKIKAAVDDIFPSGDYKYDAEMAAEALVENNPKLFGGQLYEDLDDMIRSDVYGLVLKELSQRNALKMQATRAARSQGPVVDTTITEAVTPRGFSLNVERAVSELNIPREEAERIARLSSDQQKAALQTYLDRDLGQRFALSEYNPKKFDAAKGGLAKILEV